jgi:HD domain
MLRRRVSAALNSARRLEKPWHDQRFGIASERDQAKQAVIEKLDVGVEQHTDVAGRESEAGVVGGAEAQVPRQLRDLSSPSARDRCPAVVRAAVDDDHLIETHTVEGQPMLEGVGGLLGEVGTIVRSCHERYDGLGYPDRLAGEAIPLEARIVACCDAFNAMTTDRPYRAALRLADALEELRVHRARQFDPNVVDALLAVTSRLATWTGRKPVIHQSARPLGDRLRYS